MVKSEQVVIGAGLLGLAYLYLNKSGTLPPGGGGGGGDGSNPPGWDETEGGTRSSITPKEFATWAERQEYFLNLPEDQRPLSYFTKEPIDPTQPAGSPANPLSPLKPFGPIISWESWYEIRNVQSTGISKSDFVAHAKGFMVDYMAELMATRGGGGQIQVYDSDFQAYFGADWRLWQQALGYGGTADASFDNSGNYMPDGTNVYDFPIDNPGYQAWINAGNFGGYYDWLATGKDSGYAAYKSANPGGMDYHQWQTANRPNYTVYRTPDGEYTDYWNGQYVNDWLVTNNPLLGGTGGGGGGSTVQPVAVSDLKASPTTVTTGGTTTITFKVTNPNAVAVDYTLQFSGLLTNASVSGTLQANGATTHSISVPVNFTGQRTSSIDGKSVSVTGQAPANSAVQISGLRVSDSSVVSGGSVKISFEITNPNSSSVNYNVAFSGNLTTKSFSGTLVAFETASKSFWLAVDFTGTRSASIGGQTVSVTGYAAEEPPPPCEPTNQPSAYHDTANRQYIPYYWNTAQCMWLLDYASAYPDGTTPPPDEPPYSYADLPQPYSNCTQLQHDAAVYFGKSYNYYSYGQCQTGIPPVGAYIVPSCSGGL